MDVHLHVNWFAAGDDELGKLQSQETRGNAHPAAYASPQRIHRSKLQSCREQQNFETFSFCGNPHALMYGALSSDRKHHHGSRT
jgi:hypothetical protein